MKNQISKIIGIFLALAGLLGVIVQLLTSPGPLRVAAFVGLFLAMLISSLWVAIAGAWTRHRAEGVLPPVERIEEICTGYSVVPATEDDLLWIARLEARVFSEQDAVPEMVLREWYAINPHGFFIIKEKNGERVGNLTILPLRPSTLRAFSEGHILDKDIRGDSLYSSTERHSIRDLYVESIIVSLPKGKSNAPALLCILSRIGLIMRRLCDMAEVDHIYAIAASSSGEKFMKRLGFVQVKSAEVRKDGHDLFAVKFANLATIIATMCGEQLKNPELLRAVLPSSEAV